MLHQRLYEAQTAGLVARPRSRARGARPDRRQKQTALFIANGLDEIHRASTRRRTQFTVIWGAREAYRCLDRLKSSARASSCRSLGKRTSHRAEQAVRSSRRAAERSASGQHERLDRWKQSVGGLKALSQEKVLFAISSEGLPSRRKFKGVRQAIAAGFLARRRWLPSPAMPRPSGLDTRLGTLSAGKLAHITVLNGPFDDERSKVRFIFVDGQRFEYNKGAEPVPAGSSANPAASLAGSWQMRSRRPTARSPPRSN